MKKVKKYILASIASLTLCSTLSFAKTFPLPAEGDVVGKIGTATIKPGDNFAQLARDYDLGYFELTEANPGVDPDNPKPGTVIVIPSRYILPNAPRRGLVVNIAEMRLYYYPHGRAEVITYPIGIGREGEDTPIGVMSIIERRYKPTWNVPESIRTMRAKEGVFLPKAVPPGPENPLGEYALRLSNPTYLIHGTNEPLGGIGRRSSSGCLRLYPEDIERLYHMVSNGTPVYIINEPYKAGWSQGKLYLESHVPLQESGNKALDDPAQIKHVVNTALQAHQAGFVDWNKALQISEEVQGIPQQIGEV